MANRILALDPSGTGTTGIYFKNGEKEEFQEYKEKDWQKHYAFIASLVKVYQPNILLFENTNFISKRTKDGLNLFRLLGAVEVLEIEKKSVNVLKVKELYKKLVSQQATIQGLTYSKGRGHGW